MTEEIEVRVPRKMEARVTDDIDAEVAADIEVEVQVAEPGLVTVEQRKDARGDRIYADIMRNGYAQTAVAPYSVRARPGAPVAVQLHWDELGSPGLTAGAVTIRTIAARLDQLASSGDPWADLARHRYGLARPRRLLRGLA